MRSAPSSFLSSPAKLPLPQNWVCLILPLKRAFARRHLGRRAENMPKENIERSIKKASGADSETYAEVRYEGYAPGGVAIIVEALTDNRNRTAGEVRSYFSKSGGSLAETGAVSFLFDHVGVIEFPAKAASEDAMMEAAIEAGADDVQTSGDSYEVHHLDRKPTRGCASARVEIRRAAQGEFDLEAT